MASAQHEAWHVHARSAVPVGGVAAVGARHEGLLGQDAVGEASTRHAEASRRRPPSIDPSPVGGRQAVEQLANEKTCWGCVKRTREQAVCQAHERGLRIENVCDSAHLRGHAVARASRRHRMCEASGRKCERRRAHLRQRATQVRSARPQVRSAKPQMRLAKPHMRLVKPQMRLAETADATWRNRRCGLGEDASATVFGAICGAGHLGGAGHLMARTFLVSKLAC